MVQCFRILSLLSDDSFLVLLPLSNADTQMVCGEVTPQNLRWFLVSEVECPPWISGEGDRQIDRYNVTYCTM